MTVYLDGLGGVGVSRLEVIEGPDGRWRRTKTESMMPGVTVAVVARKGFCLEIPKGASIRDVYRVDLQRVEIMGNSRQSSRSVTPIHAATCSSVKP